uniref:Uncharacterized protein n=1 Tax=Nelumbo nucifera TaxID=4432 RepID=A0A822ZA13_NELNU|nr:TPA_asm: hypothetical protein HUJ06_016245 [Nelumbo nucifera]
MVRERGEPTYLDRGKLKGKLDGKQLLRPSPRKLKGNQTEHHTQTCINTRVLILLISSQFLARDTYIRHLTVC